MTTAELFESVDLVLAKIEAERKADLERLDAKFAAALEQFKAFIVDEAQEEMANLTTSITTHIMQPIHEQYGTLPART